MELIGQQLISAPVDRTWVALNDPGILKGCIAGCESIDRVSDNEYAVAMAVRIGPVNAKFKGKLKLENLQPPTAYTINFEARAASPASARVRPTSS
jgi:carbon monoxide dehydrogenase subunit G